MQIEIELIKARDKLIRCLRQLAALPVLLHSPMTSWTTQVGSWGLVVAGLAVVSRSRG
jgi:hypothetical protein